MEELIKALGGTATAGTIIFFLAKKFLGIYMDKNDELHSVQKSNVENKFESIQKELSTVTMFLKSNVEKLELKIENSSFSNQDNRERLIAIAENLRNLSAKVDGDRNYYMQLFDGVQKLLKHHDGKLILIEKNIEKIENEMNNLKVKPKKKKV